MQTMIALLRGINVGGKDLLPMKELSTIFTKMGCRDVRTYIQSGNVIFTSTTLSPKALGRDIAEKIAELKGFRPEILLLSTETFKRALIENPFPNGDGKLLHLFFLTEKPTAPNSERLNAVKSPSEEFKLGEEVFYLYAPEGIGRSKLVREVEKALGVPATARNWNTVMKISAMTEEDGLRG